MHRLLTSWSACSFVVISLLVAACGPAGQPTPAAAPTRQEAKPVATTAPAQPAATQPPAAKPTEKPVAKADAKAVEEFYRGKTIRVIVGTTAGALFDAWARLLARHMPKYIPGNPTMVVENMPGAGFLIAANYLYNVAPKDGTTIGTFVETQVINQLTGGKGVEFDMAQYQWIGAVMGSNLACLVRTDTPAKISDVKDILGPGARESVFGTTGPGSSGYEYPLLVKELLGANIKLVSGYPGNQEVRLAIEKGEADGYCATWDALRRGLEPWKAAGKPPYKVIVQEGASRHPDIPEVPLSSELAKNDDDRLMFKLMHGPNNFAKPYAAPPGTPPERVEALRQAFMAAFKDPELIAEANKSQLDFEPRTGPQVEAGFKEILATPKAAAERFAKLIGR